MIPLPSQPQSQICPRFEDGVPTIAFMGESSAIRLAYSDCQRKELSTVGKVAGVDLNTDNWIEYPELTREIDILFATWNVPKMDAAFLKSFPRLKAVFYAAGTVKYFMTDEAFDRGVIVSSAAGANAIPVAEYTLSAILMSLKNFWRLPRRPVGQQWQPSIESILGGYHAVVGLISLGMVGRAVARLLSRFDTDVIAYDPYVSEAVAKELNVKLVSLEELFIQSNVISVHTPLIPETVHLIDGGLLRLMKHSATFINTSRGAIVNEEALCQVMKERPDLTALLDVTWPEPPAEDSPLLGLKNVILTPHIAGSYGNEVTRMGDLMVEEMKRFLNGEDLYYQVTQEMLGHTA